MSPPSFVAVREQAREQNFSSVWSGLNTVFADVAPYYDRANYVASLGLWNWFLNQFMSVIELRPGMQALDICAGTNAIGIALLKREPTLKIRAMDRSVDMQEVGRQRAEALGFHIESTIGDVHKLPFPDNHFDIVTIQYASRHLRVSTVFKEVLRVLKPGGHFYHGDMLRPGNCVVEKMYYAYLRMCLTMTGFLFRSGPIALQCKDYFINALQMFYSADELSHMLRSLGFEDVSVKSVFAGMIGFHSAAKPR